MEEILDALRRIISRWVETVTPITADVSPGDTILYVDSTKRFGPGDIVQIEDATEGETNIVVDSIVNFTTLQLATPIFNSWAASDNILLRKTINGLYVEGIYMGAPEVIPRYPAITVTGTTVDSEWLTLRSTTERYEVEVAVHVEAATQEDGYRFILRMQKEIVKGLKKNIFPLVNDYDTVQITGDINIGDWVLRVADSSVFNTQLTTGAYPQLSDARIIIEDRWTAEESRVQQILSPTEIFIQPAACMSYLVDNNAIAIRPNRFIYNSWPHHVDIGNTSKNGTLLQTAVVRWFAQEEIPVDLRHDDPNLK